MNNECKRWTQQDKAQMKTEAHKSNLKCIASVAKIALLRANKDMLNARDIERMHSAISRLINAMRDDGYIIEIEVNDIIS